MSLFKKTFILTGQPPKGYLTALKIGATRGVKLTLNALRPEMTLAVRIGSGKTEAFPIRALKDEFRVAEDFDDKTEFKAVVFEQDTVFAHTGSAPSIRYGEWTKTEVTKLKHEDSVAETSDFDQSKPGKKSELIKTAVLENPEPKAEKRTAKQTDAVYFEPVLKREETVEASKEEKAEPVEAEIIGDAEKETFGFFKKQAESHFYDRIRARIEEMFVVHPKEESLEKLIPDSRWVRVPYSQDEFYVVGVLTDAGRVTHIGYGVRGLRSVFPPKEAEALSEFLPTSGDEGYWLMFQDAETGEMLPIE